MFVDRAFAKDDGHGCAVSPVRGKDVFTIPVLVIPLTPERARAEKRCRPANLSTAQVDDIVSTLQFNGRVNGDHIRSILLRYYGPKKYRTMNLPKA